MMALLMEPMGGVDPSIASSLAAAAEVLAGIDPLADPLFPMTLLTARAVLGRPADPSPLLREWVAASARSGRPNTLPLDDLHLAATRGSSPSHAPERVDALAAT